MHLTAFFDNAPQAGTDNAVVISQKNFDQIDTPFTNNPLLAE
jgi:hypothetical protein